VPQSVSCIKKAELTLQLQGLVPKVIIKPQGFSEIGNQTIHAREFAEQALKQMREETPSMDSSPPNSVASFSGNQAEGSSQLTAIAQKTPVTTQISRWVPDWWESRRLQRRRDKENAILSRVNGFDPETMDGHRDDVMKGLAISQVLSSNKDLSVDEAGQDDQVTRPSSKSAVSS